MKDNEYNGIVYILQHRVGWYYRNNGGEILELPECEEEHIRESIIEEYNQGQLCYYHYDHEKNTEKEYFGWWSILSN